MGALSKTLLYPLGALETKAKAAEIGIIFSWELGPREIILERDSQIVMNVIANHDPGPIQIQQLVAGIKYWEPKFRAWKTSFTRKEGNQAAHLMAKHAKQISECTIWVKDTPPITVSQILNDLFDWVSAQFYESLSTFLSKRKKKEKKEKERYSTNPSNTT